MERARLVSLRGSTLIEPLSSLAETSAGSTSSRAPFGPFIFTVWPSTLAVTPDGMATAFLPIRDMVVASVSEHRAQDLAADIGVARGVIRHHALRRGDDRDAEAVVDARQPLSRRIDPPARLRHAGNLADHRRAVEILELDLDLAAPVAVRDGGVAADVAFGLEHFEHALAQLRGGRRHLRLRPLLRIADAGDQVADRISHRHGAPLLTSSTSRGRGSFPWRPARAARCGSS